MSIHYKAVLVGNGVYEEDPQSLLPLKGPANDLRAMAAVLTHDEVGLHRPEDVAVLLDRSRNEILETLEQLFAQANRDDQLLVYYSGHGELDKRKNLYLCASDTRTSSLISTAISDAAINSMIANSVSQRILLILDCCNSGRFKAAAALPKLPAALAGRGRFVLASSRASELSKDAQSDSGLSPFTHFLVRAMHAYEADTSNDGFVSVSEVYDHLLPRLADRYKQRPLRNFDNSEGGLALARCPGSRPVPPRADTRPAKLAVSTESIEITDVGPNEELPDEIIDVFNEGGGELEWQAHCEDDWVELRRERKLVRLSLRPGPGINRGRLYIRAGKAGTKRITLRVDVHEEILPPTLSLSAEAVDFGEVHVGTRQVATVRLYNLGDGLLQAKASTRADWLGARLIGDDLLELQLRTDQPGQLRGSVIVTSDGGDAQIPVRAEVKQGPVLAVAPLELDFRRVSAGESGYGQAAEVVWVENSGGGELHWSVHPGGDFFELERFSDRFRVTLRAGVGKHLGSILVSGNGGRVTVGVRAEVVPRVRARPATAQTRSQSSPPPSQSVAGRWGIRGVGSITFVGSGPVHVYAEHNVVGVQVGQGQAAQQGAQLTLRGYNIEAGQVQGQFILEDDQLTGSFGNASRQIPCRLVRG